MKHHCDTVRNLGGQSKRQLDLLFFSELGNISSSQASSAASHSITVTSFTTGTSSLDASGRVVHRQLVSHLPGAVAPLAAQVLAVCQQPSGARTLEGEPRVNEGRGTAVVIHEERLRVEKTSVDEVVEAETHAAQRQEDT